jgi:hypothetical protein
VTVDPPLGWTDVAAVLARSEASRDAVLPDFDDVTIHQRFDGRYTVTFEVTHYGAAFQLAEALELIRERDTAPCQITWARVKPVNDKYAVVRVVSVEARGGRKAKAA